MIAVGQAGDVGVRLWHAGEAGTLGEEPEARRPLQDHVADGLAGGSRAAELPILMDSSSPSRVPDTTILVSVCRKLVTSCHPSSRMPKGSQARRPRGPACAPHRDSHFLFPRAKPDHVQGLVDSIKPDGCGSWCRPTSTSRNSRPPGGPLRTAADRQNRWTAQVLEVTR